MPRILLSCMAKLTEGEITFLKSVREELGRLGHELIFLSPHNNSSLHDATIHLSTKWRSWPETLHFDEIPCDEAKSLVDIPTWLRRVEHWAGDRNGVEDCLPLMEMMLGIHLALLRALQPALFVCWNPTDPSTGLMYDIARKLAIPTFSMERGSLPMTFNIDRRRKGISDSLAGLSWSEIAWLKDPDEYGSTGKSFIGMAYRGGYSRYRQKAPHALKAVCSGRRAHLRPRVLVLGGFDSANGISPGDPAKSHDFPGYESGFDLARKVAYCHQGITIYKPHPGMTRAGDGFDVRGVTNLICGTGDPKNYLDWADIVVSYGSTLEYAALALETPLVLAGRCTLFGKGVAYEAISRKELSQAIGRANTRDDFDAMLGRFRCFVGYIITEYLVRFDTDEERTKGVTRWCEELDRHVLSITSSAPFDKVRKSLQSKQSYNQRRSRLVKAKVERVVSILRRVATS